MKISRLTPLLALLLLSCVHTAAVDDYVSLRSRLDNSSPEELVSWKQRLERENRENPSLDSEIRLALALSAPGSSDEERTKAKRLFNNVLLFRNALPMRVRDFVSLVNQDIDRQLAVSERVWKNEKKIQRLEKERDQLKAHINSLQLELDEARKKIRALTTIEKSIEDSKKTETP